MGYRPGNSGPSTASNSLRILETVARLGTGTTAKEISDALQMAPATVYRMVNALVGDEYLVRTADLRGFALGHAISGLIAAATPPNISTAARSEIEKFRTGNRFPVHLILIQNASLKIADDDPDYPLQMKFEVMRYPHASAAGKLMLAHLDESARPFLKGPLAEVTRHTITNRSVLEKQLVEIRVAGQATEINELEEGSSCLALPVNLPNGPVQAALCLSGPSERFSAICERAEAARVTATRLAPLIF
ncbi:IclR family transcriptional regulator [Arthrobacter sedimenti]|uniref:IclR family transcriptional regulator n=1 Tax=Arthrobacter sedimenti TaxID=2694931 RepID=UPI000B357FBB|nr:IclR family transcriptional regulator C-terminal domain-containing protein [Arthrobacter sedimenti]OUM44705.1 IclR family transcriptional regulator [Arthrobacter agilis]